MVSDVITYFFKLYLLTVLIELPFYYLFLKKSVPDFFKLVLLVLAINGVSHPIAVFGFYELNISFFLIELIVVIIEGVIIRLLLAEKLWFSLVISLTANVVSSFFYYFFE